MNKETIYAQLTGKENPGYITEREDRVIDYCLGIINGLEEEIKQMKEQTVSQNIDGCKVLVIGAGENNAQLIEHLSRARAIENHIPIINIDAHMRLIPERHSMERLMYKAPNVIDNLLDQTPFGQSKRIKELALGEQYQKHLKTCAKNRKNRKK